MRLLEAASPSLLEAAELSSALNAMRPHDILVVSELAVADLRELLGSDPPRRPVLCLDLSAAQTADRAVSLALDALASAVATFWPALWGEDWSDARDDALGRAHRPLRLGAASKRLPDLVPSWADAAVGCLLRGRPPRVPRAAPEIEWGQLALAISPDGVTLVAPLEDGPGLAQRITGLEWLARHGGVCVLVLTRDRPSRAGFDRILHGYRPFRRAARPPGSAAAEAVERDGAERIVIALPPAPEGLPHPMSPNEQKLFRLIQADDELRPLFAFNRTVPDIPLRNVRVDIVWLEGRVAIEIDGCEHRSVAKFRADRHRDYELMCAGYRVLRMTNEDVETDAPFAVEKIRRVARLARGDVG
jgi:very-short-patch-repair endonuclease